VLETINLPAVSIDKKGSLIFCNKHMAHILGYDQNEILGLNWLEKFVPENQREALAEAFRNNKFDAQFINSVLCRNGEERIINWQNTVSYDENGKIKEITASAKILPTARKLPRR